MTSKVSDRKPLNSFIVFAILFLIVIIFAFYKYRAPNKHAEVTGNVEVMVPIRVINLDTARRNDSVSGTFKIYNVDKSVLKIKEVRPDCFCTISTANKETVNPGDSAEIKLTFKYVDTDFGYFQKSAFIESNAAKNPILLTIRGYLQR